MNPYHLRIKLNATQFKYLLSTHYVLSTVLNCGNIAVNKQTSLSSLNINLVSNRQKINKKKNGSINILFVVSKFCRENQIRRERWDAISKRMTREGSLRKKVVSG